MICEVCGKNATFFFKQTKNGYTAEKALCSECAAKQGFSDPGSIFDALQDDFFGGLLGSFVNKEPKLVSTKSCDVCGMTISELLNGGKVGCANCYRTFERSLLPTISKIHGNVAHNGKIPVSLEEKPKEEKASEISADTEVKETKEPPAKSVSELKALLMLAVEKQEYEQAALLRDKIKALEEAENKSENGGEEK